ncbi:MAG: hypothetical protein AAGJ12_13835 [Bacteroidota bacterium]
MLEKPHLIPSDNRGDKRNMLIKTYSTIKKDVEHSLRKENLQGAVERISEPSTFNALFVEGDPIIKSVIEKVDGVIGVEEDINLKIQTL